MAVEFCLKSCITPNCCVEFLCWRSRCFSVQILVSNIFLGNFAWIFLLICLISTSLIPRARPVRSPQHVVSPHAPGSLIVVVHHLHVVPIETKCLSLHLLLVLWLAIVATDPGTST